MIFLALQQTTEPVRIGHPILGYILPAAIFIISFWVAWACFKYFTRKLDSK